MADIQKVQNLLEQATRLLNEAKLELGGVETQSVPFVTTPPQLAAAQQVSVDDSFDSFESLKKALESNRWPEAVNPNLICDPNSESDKIERGRGIIELMIEEDLKGLKFLDFGCGEGHCVALTTEYGTIKSVGYDVKKQASWDNFLAEKQGLILTNDFAEVEANAPYDVIIMFDVLDHLIVDQPVEALRKVEKVLAPNGKVYVRTHPFSSRHGTHLYHDLNKAYIHLVFTPAELKLLVPEPKFAEPSLGISRPLATYQALFASAKFKVESTRQITEKVEPFFKIPKIAERIMKNTKLDFFPEFQMSLQFVDFVLKKNNTAA
jgi:2-polyprenyl-3-methyl-5-hydroxy-6-metoxy-1,4-benzoquinol methylase